GVPAAIMGLGLLASFACDSPTRETDVAPAPPIAATPEPAVTPPAVVPGAPLAVSCGASPRSGMAPLRVEFTAAAAGGNGSHAYAWSFGDDAGTGNRNPAHV